MALSKTCLRLVAICSFYVLYLVIGASILSTIEGPEEREKVKSLKAIRSSFLQNNKECLSDAELEEFIEHIIRANNRGVSALRNVTGDPNWTFGPSLFFAGTILTTIGYGHVTPLSEGGKVFCIVYAAIGIPLTLIMFTALVERLMVITSKLKECLVSRLGHLYKAMHIRLIHVGIIFLFLIIFVFLVPASIFMVLEDDWNYLDAFYYCFISMTTIGLGDYIPGDDHKQPHRQLYKILTTVYLFMGLILMMLTLANVYDVPELNIGYHFYMRSDEEMMEGERTRLRTNDKPTYSTTAQDNTAYQGDNGAQKGDKEQLTTSSQ